MAVISLSTDWVSAHASGHYDSYPGYYDDNYRGGAYWGFHGYAEDGPALGLLAGVLLGYALLNPPGHSLGQSVHRNVTHRYPRIPRTDSSCLQQREYQTIIIMDGEQIPAWGVACLQPDGSWRRLGMAHY